MLEYLNALIARYRSKGLLIDTNILLLYIVGSYDVQFVGRFKRVRQFAAEDFQLLATVVHFFTSVITTPHILTEVSNLLNQLPAPQKKACLSAFGQLIPRMQEMNKPAATLGILPHFPHFGLTDTAIAELAPGHFLVLTDDLPLYHYLAGTGVDVINFNHIRTLSWT